MSKITFIITSLAGGGAEHQLCELLNNLDKRADFNEIELITFADVDDHYALSKNIIRKRIAPYKNKIIKYILLFFAILTTNSGCIVAFGLRESRFILPAILFRHIKFIVGDRNLTIDWGRGLNYIIYKILFWRANVIVPNSYSEQKQIKKYFPNVGHKINVITNYTDINKYKFQKLPENEILKICIFARFDPQKNCERFVHSVKLLTTLTNKRFEIHWYGSSKIKNQINPYYIQLQRLIEEQGLSKQFKLKEAITDVDAKMAEYDAFCLPSLFEGFSNSISEAICCGKPCIVSDVSDNSIMVHNGENGFLFDPIDENSIANGLLKFLETDAVTRQLMGKRSRDIAESMFNLNDFINGYIRVLK